MDEQILSEKHILSEETINAPQVKAIFSEEELNNISDLCSILQKIRTRLISEGYSIDELREKLLGKKLKK